MKLFIYCLIISVMPILVSAALCPEDILSGLQDHNRALHIKDGWMRDPYIMIGPDDMYYLTGTTPDPGDPREFGKPYNSGLDRPDITASKEPSIVGSHLRVWRSADLATWEYVDEVFEMGIGYWAGQFPEQFAALPRGEWRMWAPEVHFIDGQWVLVHTSPAPVKGGAELALSKGDQLEGPYTHPMKEATRGCHDPSLFKNDDGTVYLLWGNTWISPLKPGYEGYAADPIRIDPSDRRIGHEGAMIRKIGDQYVHFGTGWSTDQMRKGTYNLYYCTADKITGPYGPRQFAGRFLGHGTMFQDKEGRWWCTAFYNANVPPISRYDALKPSVGDNAHTINPAGVTIVPMEVRILENGDIHVRAKDPAYAHPGPEEVQEFGL